MPLGALIDVFCVITGGLLGGCLKDKVSQKLSDNLNLTFGFGALLISIKLLVSVRNLGAVVLSLLISTTIGCLLDFSGKLDSLIVRTNRKLFKNNVNLDVDLFSIAVVLFAFSVTGILGIIMEATTADKSVILAKAVLDFFTALIFASKLGYITSLVAIPQIIVYIICFFSGKGLLQLISGDTYGDFQAAGGLVNMMVGLKLTKSSPNVKPFNSILAIVLIIPISIFWQKLF